MFAVRGRVVFLSSAAVRYGDDLVKELAAAVK